MMVSNNSAHCQTDISHHNNYNSKHNNKIAHHSYLLNHLHNLLNNFKMSLRDKKSHKLKKWILMKKLIKIM